MILDSLSQPMKEDIFSNVESTLSLIFFLNRDHNMRKLAVKFWMFKHYYYPFYTAVRFRRPFLRAADGRMDSYESEMKSSNLGQVCEEMGLSKQTFPHSLHWIFSIGAVDTILCRKNPKSSRRIRTSWKWRWKGIMFKDWGVLEAEAGKKDYQNEHYPISILIFLYSAPPSPPVV